ncbi:MAG: energy-coupling factor transporter transmembrane protein EcfT [Lachnospiraceae bacterium]|nr:energy-coupling factor transporter transmembrane protein EcfT [Lachnospiraceae bacterium]
MMREITIGQYYPAKSVIHSLDPRVKLFGTLMYIIALFIANSVSGFVFMTIVLSGIIIMSKVPFGYMVKGLKAIVVLLVVAGLFNLFLTPGIPVFTFWKFSISMAGIRGAALMVFRMIYLIIGTSIMSLTTTPNQLTDGLEKSMRPLSAIGVPVHEIAMMMSIALRFIPILTEETDKIMKAQMARGADFDSGGIIRKAKALVPLLVPLFVSAFRRANDLALAMEARCYNGGEGRTKMKPLSYETRDGIAYLIILIAFIGIIAVEIFRKKIGFI